MKRSVKISFDITNAPQNLLSFIQKTAKELEIEGTTQQVTEGNIKLLKIIAQGKSEQVEQFVDFIHAGYEEWLPSNIEEEPFLSTRDYRGIFRIIE